MLIEEYYFLAISLLFGLFAILAVVYLGRLTFYLFNHKKYWNKLYFKKKGITYPKKVYWDFLAGKEDFGDAKIKLYRKRAIQWIIATLCMFGLAFVSIIVLSTF